MARELRPHQVEAVAGVEGQWGAGVTRTAVVIPTGSGKTDVIADIATRHARGGGRPLLLAHRAELLDQMQARCGMYAPDIRVGRVQAGRNETRCPITVAMQPTLAREARRARMRPPTMVIMDEAHHAASPSYMGILQWAGSFSQVPTLGVTATMVRGDKRKLGDVWQSIAYERSTSWAIDDGLLVRPRARVVVTDHMDLERAKISKGDFQDGELGEMVAQDVDQIVKAWLEHAADRITVAFVPSLDAGSALAEAFRAQGIPVGEVYGSTKLAERGDAAKGTGLYGALAQGRIRVLINCMVATEGWDCPEVSCVLVARPTRLPGLYAQMVGRGLRLSPGKTDCLVLDVVGTSRNQKLVSLIDLLPSAEIDSTELDELPCPDCGERRIECTCEREATFRDPDGGRRRLFGPAMYEDIDLFSSSTYNWLFTRKGLRFLAAGSRIAVLWPLKNTSGEDQQYSIGHCSARATLLDYADGKWLDDEVPHTLEEAKRVAERWAEQRAGQAERLDAKAHAKPALVKDVRLWEATIKGAAGMTRGRLADEVDVLIASKLLDQGVA